MSADEQELIAAVEESPLAVGRKDRSGWIGLFADDGVIEDPVGSRPHVGLPAIARFYDTFIGPREIRFHRNHDVVSGGTVIRDVALEIGLGRHQPLFVPAILRYDLDPTAGGPAIRHLRAYWDLPAMVGQLARRGPAASVAGSALAVGLLRHQRISGTVGFARGFHNPARRGRRVVTRFVRNLIAGDLEEAEKDLHGPCVMGDGGLANLQSVVGRMVGMRLTKAVIAGDVVVASAHSTAGAAVVFIRPSRRGGTVEFVECFIG